MALKCSSCKLECNDDNALVCDLCACNIHFSCSELPIYLITFLEMSDEASFCCKKCAQNKEDYRETRAKVEQAINHTPSNIGETYHSTPKTGSLSTPKITNTPKVDPTSENDTITERLAKIDSIAMERKRVCHFFRQNKCKHGSKGSGCAFRHPTPCKKHINGHLCRNMEKCSYWHPQLCRHGTECRNNRCKRYHVSSGKFRHSDPKNQLGLPSSWSRSPRSSTTDRSRNQQLINLLTQVISMIT